MLLSRSRERKAEINKMAKIENIKVFGIEDSFRASKYPFATDINNCFDMENWNYWNSFKGFVADFFFFF